MKHMRNKMRAIVETESLEQLTYDMERGYTRDLPAPLSDPLEILIMHETIINEAKRKAQCKTKK